MLDCEICPTPQGVSVEGQNCKIHKTLANLVLVTEYYKTVSKVKYVSEKSENSRICNYSET
jgi:hypothetical protein